MLVNLDEKMLCEYKGSILLNEFYSEKATQKSLIEKLGSIIKEDIKFKINENINPETNEKFLFLDFYKVIENE